MSASRSTTPPPRARPLALGALIGLAVVGAVLWSLLTSSGSTGAPEPSAPPQLVMDRPTIIPVGVTLQGSLEFEDPDAPGGRVRASSGSFVLEAVLERERYSLSLAVERGVWSCRLPVAWPDLLRLSASQVQIGDRFCESSATIALQLGGVAPPEDVTVLARCALSAQLEIVDALTKQRIPVAWAVPAEGLDVLIPDSRRALGFEPRLLREAPIDLAPLAKGASEQEFLVSSPGYAWQRITVDMRRKSVQLVELSPGGTISIVIPDPGALDVAAGEVFVDRTELELLQLGPEGPRSVVARLSVFPGSTRLPCVPVGDYELRRLFRLPRALELRFGVPPPADASFEPDDWEWVTVDEPSPDAYLDDFDGTAEEEAARAQAAVRVTRRTLQHVLNVRAGVETEVVLDP